MSHGGSTELGGRSKEEAQWWPPGVRFTAGAFQVAWAFAADLIRRSEE